MIEASITAFNVLAVGIIVRMLCARLPIAYLITPLFLLVCLIIATLSAAILVSPADALAWLTPGAQLGLTVGTAILLVAMALPATPRLMIAPLALMAGTVLVNLAPPNDSAVIVRGPLATRYMQQFLRQCLWGDLDYLVVDMPPGTGDVNLSLCEEVKLDGAIIVTTPQRLAFIDVLKGIQMFK